MRDRVDASESIDLCRDVTCEAIDDCHTAGACDARTGKCAQLAVADGTPCDDGLSSTAHDICIDGTCGRRDCSVDNGGCGDAHYTHCIADVGAMPVCEDIDECATDNGGCGDAALTRCIDNAGAAPTCEDIDECATDNGGCGHPDDFRCVNQTGSLPACMDITACHGNPCGPGGTCVPETVGYRCECEAGYAELEGRCCNMATECAPCSADACTWCEYPHPVNSKDDCYCGYRCDGLPRSEAQCASNQAGWEFHCSDGSWQAFGCTAGGSCAEIPALECGADSQCHTVE